MIVFYIQGAIKGFVLNIYLCLLEAQYQTAQMGINHQFFVLISHATIIKQAKWALVLHLLLVMGQLLHAQVIRIVLGQVLMQLGITQRLPVVNVE
jgi:hypothetical protein